MHTKKKIFNDPVYGFVEVPHGILLELVDHPFFQRLRRIRQVGLSSYVYPGALHTRFHHALGALHLMQEAIEVLRSKGTDISPAEAEGACIAILLHDIGHGPYSHALENALIERHHEALSRLFMEKLSAEHGGGLRTAIEIFNGTHPKRFLHQLVSGQLDMDRLDYLNRDSFFTGVSEGVIGYDRIIKMLAVNDGELCVEEKGIYSIEKFLIARRLMYWQVYLHKTVLAAEQMLISAFKRAKELAREGVELEMPKSLRPFFYGPAPSSDELIERFARLDDTDVTMALKDWSMGGPDAILSFLAKGLTERRLFRLEFSQKRFESDRAEALRLKAAVAFKNPAAGRYLVLTGKESNSAYSKAGEQIFILFKDGRKLPINEVADASIRAETMTKHYLAWPKTLI